jgi:hypothetical protein
MLFTPKQKRSGFLGGQAVDLDVLRNGPLEGVCPILVPGALKMV